MFHINGYVYGNMPDLEDICEGEEIVIYIFALANGIHDMQIYGQTFTFKNHRFVVIQLRRHTTKPTKWPMCPVDSEDSDQAGRMLRLIADAQTDLSLRWAHVLSCGGSYGFISLRVYNCLFVWSFTAQSTLKRSCKLIS